MLRYLNLFFLILILVLSSCFDMGSGKRKNTQLIGYEPLTYSQTCPSEETLAQGCTCSDEIGTAVVTCPSCESIQYDAELCSCEAGIITCNNNPQGEDDACESMTYDQEDCFCEDGVVTCDNEQETATLPTFSVVDPNGNFISWAYSGAYVSGTKIKMASATPGASIHYTTDGIAPTCNSTPYSTPYTLTANVSLKAIACKTDFNPSAVRTENYTLATVLLGFNDGKVLKINGTGGGGQNFASVNETNDAFSSLSGYSYYAGHHKFNSQVTAVLYAEGKTLIGFSNGKVLKINGTGGTGSNFAAITESENGFTPLYNTTYYVGHHKFNNGVTSMTYGGGKTLIGFSDGKVLKINGTGGGGQNFAAITENNDGFEALYGTTYYAGYHKFNSAPKSMIYGDGKTLIGFNDGKVLKINGTGGGGQNFAAIKEFSDRFEALYGTTYYVGYQKFNSAPVSMAYGDGKTLIGFNNKKVLKINGTGGGGQNFAGVTETTDGFNSISGYTNYSGYHRFDSVPLSMEYAYGKLLIGFDNKKVLKINGTGGSGSNFASITETSNGFASSSSTAYYYSGYNVFNSKCSGL